jgi:hypothetical protein
MKGSYFDELKTESVSNELDMGIVTLSLEGTHRNANSAILSTG